MNILIADDHAIVRKGLVQILKEEFMGANCVEATGSAEVYQVLRSFVWDIILLDISMPGGSGVDILKQIRAEGINAPVLMLSMHPEEQYALRVLKAGASGFVNKNSATTDLVTAIRKVLAGRKYISESLAEKLAGGTAGTDKLPHELLSDREMQVLQLLAAGKSVSEIAAEISLNVSTISTYRTRVLEKLHLANNAEITRYALDNDLAG